METIYNWRDRKILSKVPIPKKKGDYLYFISFPDERTEEKKLVKIGTTNDIIRRMKEHQKYYNTTILIEWISPAYSKWTTLRIEDRMKKFWIEKDLGEWIRNDRFLIDKDIKNITITVRKSYTFEIE